MTADGFLRTGDVGTMDEDGYVYIVDRTKDVLLCGGFNVYPRTIEEAIYKHPSVEEVSVIGIPDTYRGQSPKAFIKLKAGAEPLTFDALKAFLSDKPRQARDDRSHGCSLGIAENPGRQVVEEGALRRRGEKARRRGVALLALGPQVCANPRKTRVCGVFVAMANETLTARTSRSPAERAVSTRFFRDSPRKPIPPAAKIWLSHASIQPVCLRCADCVTRRR